MLVPHPRYLFDIGDLAPEQAAPLACSGVTAYRRAEEGRPTLQDEAGRHHRRGRRRPDGRRRSRRRWARRTSSSSTSIRPSATPRCKAGAHEGGRRRCGRRRRSRSRRRPAAAPGRWSISSARARPSISAVEQPDQGRHARGGRALRRRHHGADAATCRCARMTLHGSYVGSQSDMAELLDLVKRTGMPPVPITHAPARRGERGAQRPARRQDRRPRGADAGGLIPRRSIERTNRRRLCTWMPPHCARCRRRSRSATRAIPAPR